MALPLSPLKNWEWVPLWPVHPTRIRVTDPAVAAQVNAAKPLLEAAMNAIGEPTVVQATDREFPPLATALDGWASDGRINAAPRGNLAACAMRGAAVAFAELRSEPLRDGYTHPQWHLVLDFMEIEASDDAGPAGIMALNAAHRGFRTGTRWADSLDG